jgi:L-iditol 2-dehydrogenase
MILAEPSALRRQTATNALEIHAYSPMEETPDDNSIDLVIDCVGAVATREAACKMVRAGGVIVHLGLLPGLEGLDIRKITLQEITLSGSYCYTPNDFLETTQALINGHLGALNWFETRPLSQGQAAFQEMDSGVLKPAKLILIP